jgi:holo-[acyl-carrier protein] synthase
MRGKMNCVGIDMVEIERIEAAIKEWGGRFLNRIYTESELKICGSEVSSLSCRFAGKEAVMKALGTGVKGVGWREVEILADNCGKPVAQLYGRAESRAAELNLKEFSISLSDTRQFALAVAIGS